MAGHQELWVLALVFIAATDKGRAVTEAGLGTLQPCAKNHPRAWDTEMDPELKPVRNCLGGGLGLGTGALKASEPWK